MRHLPVIVGRMPNVLHLVVAPAEHESDIDPPKITATLVKMGCTVILRADCSSAKVDPLEILRRAVAQLEGEENSDEMQKATG